MHQMAKNVNSPVVVQLHPVSNSFSSRARESHEIQSLDHPLMGEGQGHRLLTGTAHLESLTECGTATFEISTI
jgi:hypothetical protein